MNGSDLRDVIRRIPFVPFDIKTSDGRLYAVDHPEFIAITRDLSTVLFQTPEVDRTIWIDTASIVALERSDRPATA